MSHLKYRILIFSMVISLSGCITSCEEIVVSQPELRPEQIEYANYTHKDVVRDILETGLVSVAEGQDANIPQTSALAVANDYNNNSLIPHFLFRLAQIPDSNTALKARFIRMLGATGSDLVIPTLSHYLRKNAIYEDLSILSREELNSDEFKNKIKISDSTAILRVAAAESLVRTCRGKHVHHKGSPFGVPALKDALLDDQLNVRLAAIKSLREITNHRNNYEPLADYDTRAFEQGRWKIWWSHNEGKSREEWLINGFASQNKTVAPFASNDCIATLIEIVGNSDDFRARNAFDILTHLTPSEEVKKEMNKTFEGYLSSDNEKIKRAAVVGMINLNRPIQVTRKEGVNDVVHTVVYQGNNVDPCAKFIKEWYKSVYAEPKSVEQPPEEGEEDSGDNKEGGDGE